MNSVAFSAQGRMFIWPPFVSAARVRPTHNTYGYAAPAHIVPCDAQYNSTHNRIIQVCNNNYYYSKRCNSRTAYFKVNLHQVHMPVNQSSKPTALTIKVSLSIVYVHINIVIFVKVPMD